MPSVERGKELLLGSHIHNYALYMTKISRSREFNGDGNEQGRRRRRRQKRLNNSMHRLIISAPHLIEWSVQFYVLLFVERSKWTNPK